MVFCAIAMVLRTYKPELLIPYLLGAGCVLLWMSLELLENAGTLLTRAVQQAGIQGDYLKSVLKITGIAYLVQFASNICRDAGESALSAKVELAGRAMIVTLSVPVLLEILEMLKGLLQRAG